jgi:iron complex outermembrane receptor protein
LGDRQDTQFGDVAWFSNSFDSRTSGLDVVIGYNNVGIGEGKLGFNVSGNITLENKRISPVTNNSFGEILNSLTFTSRPDSKWILGINYEIGKFAFSLNNTYFGKTTFNQDGLATNDPNASVGSPEYLAANLKTEFIPKIVTDLGVNFNATEKLTIALNVNNLFNVMPEWKFVAENEAGTALLADPNLKQQQSNLLTFNQRYSRMTYDGFHFSQLGTMFNLSLNYKF